MFKSIQKIKGLGVYSDYTKPAGTQDFAVKNLIYGWNYSGKTSLSRLFALIEAKQSNPDLAGCAFTFETTSGLITEANFDKSPLIVRVFNSDFIAKNLNFAGGAFAPILLLGAESETAQKEIDRCEALTKRAIQRAQESKAQSDSLEKSLRDAKTAEAAKIKKNLALVAIYTATHFQADIMTVQLFDESQLLPADAYQADLKLALTSDQDRPTKVDEISLSLTLNALYADSKAVMVKTPSLASTIDNLVKNPLIERWVESGLPIHTDKGICEFCGKTLDEHRLAELKAHFSQDLSDHKRVVDSLIARVKNATIVFTAPNEAALNAKFRAPFKTGLSAAIAAIDEYNDAVIALAADLKGKMDSPFVAVEPRPIVDTLGNKVRDSLTDINEAIKGHNSIVDNFVAEKNAAIARLKKHFVQQFLDTFDMDSHSVKIARLGRHLKKFDLCSEKLQAEVLRLKAIISKAQQGREEINQRLETLMGTEGVQIKVIKVGDQERFQLVRRDGLVAKHLSEGEKTAIAFAFFLTKLKELKPEELQVAIVYIDDPISSLDSNHIFQVTAMIKEAFFYQEKEGAPWVTRCGQTFFSTHNFEFFSLLRELNPQKENLARHFLVRRVAPNKSSFGNMPNSMFRYSSEYHFLFDVLHQFQNAPDKTEFNVLMLLPNAVRRFVELYTISKYPGARGQSVDQRADRIFGPEKSKRILKVLHYFSHANNIERLAENNELIFDIEAAVNELIDTIRTSDPLHMEALEAAVAQP
jgi:wobble nucleotide-excising tRNase